MAKWDAVKDAVFEAIIRIPRRSTALERRAAAVADFVKSRGHNMTWDAIRYATATGT